MPSSMLFLIVFPMPIRLGFQSCAKVVPVWEYWLVDWIVISVHFKIVNLFRKKSKYNMFMKCEMKRLKTMPVNKSKKHSVVFKEAAKNWSKKK